MKREIIRSKNFALDAAGFILDRAGDTLSKRDQFRIALAGGNTPRPIYSEMAKMNLPWERIHFTFGDERCVPPTDSQSNFRMARESLFKPGGVPDKSIARVRGEIDPETAAQEYEGELDLFAANHDETIYRHDLILLGIGDDGHTASLFPGTVALTEQKRKVMANLVPKFNSWRITFTFPLINQARHICFLVNASKDPALIQKIIAGDQQFPAAQVAPVDGAITWILGEA
jgi:6-phosphogluconolactonase